MIKTILIADDHPLFRSAMHSILTRLLDHPVLGEAGTVAELQQLLAQHSAPDLILLDLQMPGAHGLSGLIMLRGQYPDIPIAIVSASEEPGIIRRAWDHGALGFIPKSLPMTVISTAITTLLAGQRWLPGALPDRTDAPTAMESRLASLPPQQFRVLALVSEGRLNKQIAFDLKVSEATVKAHITAIFKKLGVRSRTQAVIALQSLDWPTASD